jgi:predicted RNA-binding Zn-ribbon protein involved in translation (DUF1610 family)
MTSYTDCPHCATEIMITEESYDTNFRCPDCLQWIGSESDDSLSLKTYYGGSLQINEFDLDEYEYSY